MMKTVLRGLFAGLWGVVGMAGAGFTMRRLVEPSAQVGKTHYESVVDWAHGLVQPDATPFERDTRIRIGELAHYGFGAFWGAIIAGTTRDTPLHPVRHGARYGVVMWLVAFAGYMPALGISRPLWKMQPYEFFRTLVSHLAFAITTVGTLEALRRGE